MKEIIRLFTVALLNTSEIDNAASISIAGRAADRTGAITFTDLTFDLIPPSDPIAFGLDSWATTVDGDQSFEFMSGETTPVLERGASSFSPPQDELNGYPEIIANRIRSLQWTRLQGAAGASRLDRFSLIV